jgi:hypothetical protein
MTGESRMEARGSDGRASRIAYRLGEIVQGLVYGSALTLAVCKLVTLANDTQIFRYQGF